MPRGSVKINMSISNINTNTNMNYQIQKQTQIQKQSHQQLNKSLNSPMIGRVYNVKPGCGSCGK